VIELVAACMDFPPASQADEVPTEAGSEQ